MSESTGTHIEDVRTVSIPVSDVERSLEFYQGTLGFEIRMDVPFGDGRRWIEVAAPGSPTTIALTPPGPGQSPGIDTGIRFTSGDVEADHASLKARGADVDPEIMRWPNSPPMFQLRDPDGNLLYVVQRMSEAEFSQRTRLKRFAVLVKSDETTESGAMPDSSGLEEMTRFNQQMVDAGVMLAGEGLPCQRRRRAHARTADGADEGRARTLPRAEDAGGGLLDHPDRLARRGRSTS